MLRAGPAARYALLLALSALLTACGSSPRAPERQATPSTAPQQPGAPAKPAATAPKPKPPADASSAQGPRRGAYYQDDGPGDTIPPNLEATPDAVPGDDPPLRSAANRPYTVFGRTYTPLPANADLRQRGIGSWYGRKFHGQRTSSGEIYDMFAMTAAHPTLALPSYVRVTGVQSGKTVIVRITDRGPFHADRVIDLSYTAAYKLGLINGGSGMVEVEAIIPGEAAGTAYAQATPTPPPVVRVKPAERDEIELLAQRMALEERPVQTAAMAGMSSDSGIAKGVYLQLGAFSNAENAETLKNHLARELDWLAEPMRIQPGGSIHRLQLGPYASRADADRVAERIRLALGYKPTIVLR